MAQFQEVDPPVVHVEAVLLPTCSLPTYQVEQEVKRFIATLPATVLRQNCNCWLPDILKDQLNNNEVSKYVQSIGFPDLVDDINDNSEIDTALGNIEFRVHAYQLTTDEAGIETYGDECLEFSSASHWILPSMEFHGLWENLIYESAIKKQLLNYVATMLLFSDKKVNSSVISCNRVVLLHGPFLQKFLAKGSCEIHVVGMCIGKIGGFLLKTSEGPRGYPKRPPGSGKTSLCRALAQKLCIRFSHRYKFGQLIEINSHSLFSKWFSESGKLVMKLFQNIREIIQNCDALVIILIDEVESLTHARKAAMAGTEPSDAIRVVNAVLTQIDQFRRYPNVLIMTTSNITGAIDLAFVDRADIKQYIGLPTVQSIYQIFVTCLNELIRIKVILSDNSSLLTLKSLDLMEFANSSISTASLKVYEIAQEAVGLSGRVIRKLPFLAHAMFIQKPAVTLDVFLEALKKTVRKEFQDQGELEK